MALNHPSLNGERKFDLSNRVPCGRFALQSCRILARREDFRLSRSADGPRPRSALVAAPLRCFRCGLSVRLLSHGTAESCHDEGVVHGDSRQPADRRQKRIRAADAKEVGVGNPAEETYRYPNLNFQPQVKSHGKFVNMLSWLDLARALRSVSMPSDRDRSPVAPARKREGC